MAMMKGVILGIAPGSTIVDITHSIPPQDILRAAIALQDAQAFFPHGTVHLAVIDPGVGTSRPILGAQAAGHFFVAPDNGLLSPILAESLPKVVRADRPDLAGPQVSATFHGRDIMAPLAAALANGSTVEELGEVVQTWETLSIPQPIAELGIIRGGVLFADRFGNAVTNIKSSDLEAADISAPKALVEVGAYKIAGIRRTYTEVEEGDICALIGSSERLEIAVRNGSASEALGIATFYFPVLIS